MLLATKLVQWWERSPPTIMAQVRFHSGVICGLVLALLRGFFSGYSGFPSSSKTNISKFQFDQHRGPVWKPLWPRFDSILLSYVGWFSPCSKGFSLGTLVSIPPQKPTFLNSNLISIEDLHENQLELMWLPLLILWFFYFYFTSVSLNTVKNISVSLHFTFSFHLKSILIPVIAGIWWGWTYRTMQFIIYQGWRNFMDLPLTWGTYISMETSSPHWIM